MKSHILKLFLLQVLTLCNLNYARQYYMLVVDSLKNVRFVTTSNSGPKLVIKSDGLIEESVFGVDNNNNIEASATNIDLTLSLGSTSKNTEDHVDLELSLWPKTKKLDSSVSDTAQHLRFKNAQRSNQDLVPVKQLMCNGVFLDAISHYFPNRLPEKLLFSWAGLPHPRLYFELEPRDDAILNKNKESMYGHLLHQHMFAESTVKKLHCLTARITLIHEDSIFPRSTKSLLFDYGSAVILVDNPTITHFENLLRSSCTIIEFNKFPCNCIANAKLPTIRFKLGDDPNHFDLTPYDYVVPYHILGDFPKSCYFAVRAAPENDKFWTIGAVFARRYPTEISRDSSTGEMKCTFLRKKN